MAQVLAFLGVSWMQAGCGTSYHSCGTDEDCGKWGQCESVGACSFPDTSCETKRRYGASADPAVANLCVVDEPSVATQDPSAAAGASTSDDTADASASSAGQTSDDPQPTESGPAGAGGDTDPATDAETGGTGNLTGDGATEPTDASTSTGEALDCREDPLEEFFDMPLSPCWSLWGATGIPPAMANGQLHFESELSTLATTVQRDLRGTLIELSVDAWGDETSISITRGDHDVTAVTAQRGATQGLELFIHDHTTIGGTPVLRFASLEATGLRLEERLGDVLISTAEGDEWELLHTASAGPEWDFGTLAVSSRAGAWSTALDAVEVVQ